MAKTVLQQRDEERERDAVTAVADGLPTVVTLLRDYTTKFGGHNRPSQT